jgi:hypothetical protein
MTVVNGQIAHNEIIAGRAGTKGATQIFAEHNCLGNGGKVPNAQVIDVLRGCDDRKPSEQILVSNMPKVDAGI